MFSYRTNTFDSLLLSISFRSCCCHKTNYCQYSLCNGLWNVPADLLSISSTLNAQILRTSVLSYVHQSQKRNQKSCQKKTFVQKIARLTLMKLTAVSINSWSQINCSIIVFVIKEIYCTVRTSGITKAPDRFAERVLTVLDSLLSFFERKNFLVFPFF